MYYVQVVANLQRGRFLTKLLPFFQARCSAFSAALASDEEVSNGIRNGVMDIDSDYLFRLCNNLQLVKCLHALLIVSGRDRSKFICTKLVNVYANHGDVSLSSCVFSGIVDKDMYTWNSMVSAYVRSGRFKEAVDCFYLFLKRSGLRPDFHTFPPVLKACQSVLDGRKVHCWALKLGFEWDVYVTASLIHMYTRFGLVGFARKIFDGMVVRDMVSWNAMISGYCQNGNAAEVLEILDEMRMKGVRMDSVTIASILPICAQLDDVLIGRLVHSYTIKHGLEYDLFVCNALINMYAKFHKLEDAQKIFDQMVVRDVVSWNSVIAAYEQNNDPDTALSLYNRMQLTKIQPDLLTLVSLASIHAQLNDYQTSRSIHGYVIRRGWLMADVVIGNAIVDMYAKIGITDSAHAVFESLPVKDVISWNTLMTGYAQNGLASEAIEAYQTMEAHKEILPTQGTWVSILPAYSHVGALRQGMKIHGRLIKNSLYLDVYVGTCVIDMYGKCGRLDDAMTLFYEVPRKTSVPWNAIISCHGVHGDGQQALKLFREMLDEKVKPDHVTFVSLLAACSHSGLVDEGQWCFQVMQKEFCIKPSLKHYGCMVDLLGRAGHLHSAYKFIGDMPIQPDASVWGALLGACRVHGNVELGALASDHLFEVNPDNVGYYVLLSNMYANVGKWEGVNEVRSLARDRGLKKTPGWSSIEANNRVDVFYTGNQNHPKSDEIHKELRVLTEKMKGLGYVPDLTFVLQDVEEDEKEHILTSHSERLAIAYGIISTPPKCPLHIFKNLRICGDCHTATKFISRITEREIIVRDANRFHHFKDGICSCGDYW